MAIPLDKNSRSRIERLRRSFRCLMILLQELGYGSVNVDGYTDTWYRDVQDCSMSPILHCECWIQFYLSLSSHTNGNLYEAVPTISCRDSSFIPHFQFREYPPPLDPSCSSSPFQSDFYRRQQPIFEVLFLYQVLFLSARQLRSLQP